MAKRILDNCSSLTGWSVDTNGAGTKVIDAAITTDGDGSIKHTRPVNKTRNWDSTIRKTLASGSPWFNIPEPFLTFDFRWSLPTNQLKVRLLDNAGTEIPGTAHLVGTDIPYNTWKSVRVPYGGASAKMATARYLDFYHDGDRYAGWNDGDEPILWIDNIKLESAGRKLRGKQVVLQFDDGYKDNHTYALPLFQKYGMVATIGIITDVLGGTVPGTGLAALSTAELSNLAKAGWEIASHTRGHVNMRNSSSAVQVAQMEGSKTALEALGYTVKHFIYPFTQESEVSIANSKLYYESARVGNPPRLNSRVSNIYTPDRYRLGAVAMASQSTLDDFINVVDNAIRNDQLLIIYFHDINDGAPTGNSVAPAMLDQMLNYLYRNGISTITTSAAMREYGYV